MQPDMIASALHALHLLLEPARLMFLVLGVLIGLAIGVLPGLNGIVGMAMLIPSLTISTSTPRSRSCSAWPR